MKSSLIYQICSRMINWLINLNVWQLMFKVSAIMSDTCFESCIYAKLCVPFDVRNRQKMTDINSKQATTKCIAAALVCQRCWLSCIRRVQYEIVVHTPLTQYISKLAVAIWESGNDKWGRVTWVCKGSDIALSNYPSRTICAVLDV